ncbi:Amino-acid acetyltransferase, mitochondrial [Golovinomyces cichoracearum]|uniref:Amino-acid acetyltransferase, mitochondrial n=1 Tax=Golovinomyces cichoracearum TaxID=62708 RepID=A0A420IJC6_9PEZI|nr:Amino-acid acetyltransferase, mitochondrial [Golovinomyces cichoracearum]
MIFQDLNREFGRKFACHHTLWIIRHSKNTSRIYTKILLYGSIRRIQSSIQLEEGLTKEHVSNILKKQRAQREAKALEKDFIVSVLNSSATKREAKSYIQRFAPPGANSSLSHFRKKKTQRTCNFNLQTIYGPAAIQESPKFIQQPQHVTKNLGESQKHLALVKIRAIQSFSDETIHGIGRTIYQLNRLGLTSIVVLDFNDENMPVSDLIRRDDRRKRLEVEQSNRIISAIIESGDDVARLVDNIIGINGDLESPGEHSTRTFVAHSNILALHLRRGIIPILLPIGFTSIMQNSLAVPANEVVLALSRELVGISSKKRLDENLQISPKDQQHALKNENLLDRLILLDPLGGIPTTDLSTGYHVYLNMEQEYDEVRQVLLHDIQKLNNETKLYSTHALPNISWVKDKLPFQENYRKISRISTASASFKGEEDLKLNFNSHYHLENLKLARSALSMLPSSSSALMISPEEVANSARYTSYQPDHVGTRRQVNPLIHNLLTDRPVFSPSLPSGRRRKKPSCEQDSILDITAMPITFAKHGVPVTIFPDPKTSPWIPPKYGKSSQTLTNPEINLPLLVKLINNSFGRTLDLPAYLARVDSRIAGVIIAGAYEGGAILTWESPSGADPTDTTRMVPYLDKFAVLQSSQGSGGIADLIFNCIVRKCFPKGVVWRSRKNNPVNKWYFERSRGTWTLPNTNWTMFWTTPNVYLNHQRPLLPDYENICRSIKPTWKS